MRTLNLRDTKEPIVGTHSCIPLLDRMRQENCLEFEDKLGYSVRLFV